EPGKVEPICAPELESVRLGEVSQMDLLFVIDNSSSMADKQELLKDAVPGLLRRLANPLCVGIADSTMSFSPTTVAEPCPTDFRREFEPLTDLHVGIITTSLGAMGGDACEQRSSSDEALDDRGHLLATRPRGSFVPTYGNMGFLDWDPKSQHV